MTVARDAAEELAARITPVIESAGLVCEDVSIRERGGRAAVTVVVDLPEDRTGSADLDTVAEASRRVSDHLDADDAFLGGAPYDLEVTTPGAERVLAEPRHFRRSRGRLLALRTADGRELAARLLAVSAEDVLTLRPETAPGEKPRAGNRTAEPVELPIAQVDRAQVLLEFSPPEPDEPGTAAADDTIDEG